MQYLRQSTASQSVLIGPFVDDTDGTTAETGLTIANTDIRLSANGGNIVAKNSGGGTHDELGYYTITLDATDTATVGRLQLVCKMSGALVVEHSFQVVEEEVYDMLFASSAAGIPDYGTYVPTGPAPMFGVVEGGTAQSATATTLVGRAAATDDSVQAGMTLMVFGSTQGYWQSVVIDSVSGDTFTVAAWPSATPSGTITYIIIGTPVVSSNLLPSVNVVQIEGSDATDQINAACDTALADYDAPTNAELTTAVGSVSVSEIQASALADLFNTNSGTTYASAVAGSVVSEIADNAGGSSLTVGDIADAVWDEAVTGHTTAGTFGEALDNAGSGASAASIADAVWDEAQSGHTTAGTFGEIATEIAALQTTADAIETDTQNIQSRLPTSLSNGSIDANITRINDAAVTGDGNATPWDAA